MRLFCGRTVAVIICLFVALAAGCSSVGAGVGSGLGAAFLAMQQATEAKFADIQKQLDETKQKNKELQDKVAALEASSRKKDQEIAALEGKVKAVETELAAMDEDLQKKEKQIADVEQELTKLGQTPIDDPSKEPEKLSRIAECKAKKAALEGSLFTEKELLATLKGLLQKAKDQLSS
jgi:septal ring factor EnvC (AmiA/AmiB activator)